MRKKRKIRAVEITSLRDFKGYIVPQVAYAKKKRSKV